MHPESGLVVSRVTHFYGDFCAVREADLRIEPGHVHCLLGPSGSGKSTLLRLVAGLETLQQGRITIDGVDVAGAGRNVPPEDRAIGFVFQDYALFPHLNVLRNVRFGMTGRTGATADGDARAWLDRVGMGGYARAMPHTLSGGQQQRVALARALARGPSLMLLDEPFSGLDTRLRQDIRNTTLDILRGEGVATLMVTHDPNEALLTGDRVSVIRHGRIVQSGPPAEVYTHSKGVDVAETFGPVNRLPGRLADGAVETPFGPLDASTVEASVLDGQVEILIRPESLVLHAEAATTQRPSGGVQGRIRAVAREGSLVHLTVQLGNDIIVQVHDLARHAWQLDQTVWVSLSDRSAMIVPHKTP